MSVVVAYSADAFGRAALDHAAAEAVRRDSDLVVVNVSKGQALVDTRFAGDEEITALQSRLEAAGVRVSIRHDVVPDVAEAVLTAAAETAAVLIVVGIRHRSPVGKALMGSVAQRVILDAEVPVLAVKPSLDEGSRAR